MQRRERAIGCFSVVVWIIALGPGVLVIAPPEGVVRAFLHVRVCDDVNQEWQFGFLRGRR